MSNSRTARPSAARTKAAEQRLPGAGRRGVVSRADLLEALQRETFDWFALPDPAATGEEAACGFQRTESPPPAPVPAPPPSPAAASRAPLARAPLQVPAMWTVVDIETRSPDAPREQPVVVPAVVPLPERPDPAEAGAAALQTVNAGATSTWPRVRTALRKLFDPSRSDPQRSPVDWRAATERMARGRALAPLPRRRVLRWPANLVLALDRQAPSLTPFMADMDTLAGQLRRSIGARAVQVRVLANDPRADYEPWYADRPRRPIAAGRPPPRWQPLFGGWLLLLSDLGLGKGEPARPAQFEEWVRTLVHGGTRLAALMPLPAASLPPLPRPAVPLAWGASLTARRTAPRAGRSNEPIEPEGLNDLLALVAMVGSVSDTLLRALAGLLGPVHAERALVWAAWNHADVQAIGRSCTLRDECRGRHEQRLRGLPVALLWQAHRWRQRLQAGLDWADEHLAVLRALALAPQLVKPLAGAHAAALHYVRSSLPGDLGRALPERRRRLAARAAMVVALAHPAVRGTYAEDFRGLQSLAFRDALRGGEAVSFFEELGPVSPPEEDRSREPGPLQVWQLVQQGTRLRLCATVPDDAHALLHPGLGPAALDDGVIVRLAEASRWMPAQPPMAELADLAELSGSLDLQLGRQRLRLERLARPRWARGWQRPSPGPALEVEFDTPWGSTERLRWPFDPADATPVRDEASALQARFGADPAGLYVDCTFGTVPQRFRFIEPGSFPMGSPDADEGRYHYEGPHHSVTITRGYWLADTPCTQALWRAVMGGGENPSHFEDGSDAPQCPVEQVSWDDVQRFLEQLQGGLPAGCRAGLPLEAEWEYAARAGTRTAYAWGDTPDFERANMEEKVNATTPVKRYPPNPWGLYDMHGNVWEWCADGRRGYRDRPEVDPSGGDEGAIRVLRGGSWYDPAGFARSACRSSYHRTFRWRALGFRLALRSPGPGGPSEPRRPRQRPAAKRKKPANTQR